MPYTQEELQQLDFYQNLIDEDEQRYLQNRQHYISNFQVSGSADDGSQTVRDDEGNILVFESPYTGQLDPPDQSNKMVSNMNNDNFKNDISVNDVIDRQFREF